MAVFDISSKLGNEKSVIKIAEGKEYEVDTSADKFIEVQEKYLKDNASIKDIYEVIRALLGEKALNEIKEMKISVSGLKNLLIAITAIINEESPEEMEKRFQESK